MSDQKIYTSLHMETAMTLWEYVNDDVVNDNTTDLYKYYLNTGISQLRSDIIYKLVEHCQEVYDILSEKESFTCVSWDIEYIPAYLSTISWNPKYGPEHKSVEETVEELKNI